MNPLWLGAIVGHFARDFIPAGFLPSIGGPAAPPQPGAEAQAEAEMAPEVTRAPLGPIPLDVGILEEDERIVWGAYRDPNADPRRLMVLSQGLESEGLPLAAGVIRARILELGRIRESERIQHQFAAQAAAARAAREVQQAASQVRPSSVRAGEEQVGPVPTRDQAHASGRAGEEGTPEISTEAAAPPAPEILTEAAAPPAPPAPVVQVKKKAGPRVRVTTAEPLTNGHNGETVMPPDEEENEPPPAAARA